METLAPICVCGEVLARDITPEGIIDIDGRPVPFRRTTDFLGCPKCLEVHRVIDLRPEDLRIAAARELSLLSLAG